MNKLSFFILKNKTFPLFAMIFLSRLFFIPVLFSLSSPEFFAAKILNAVLCAADFFLILFHKKFSKLFLLTVFTLGLNFYGIVLTLSTEMACGFEFVIFACIPAMFIYGYDFAKKRRYFICMEFICCVSLSIIIYVKLKNPLPSKLFLPERWKIYIFNEIFFTCISLLFLLYSCIVVDITLRRHERKQKYLYEQQDYVAKHDPLTGLMNRRRANYFFSTCMNAKKQTGTEYAIAIFDIDNFKKINDTYGHDAGDYVLKNWTKRVWDEFPEPVRIARWGGEEFLIIFPECSDDLIYKLEEVREKITKEPVKYNECEIPVTATFGLSSSETFETAEEVVNDADKMLLLGKENGKNRIVVSPKFKSA